MNKRSWLYRARPAVAHQGFKDLPDNEDMESCFLPINKKVHVSPTQLAWTPFEIPTSGQVDFVDGLKTIAGSGEPTLREGIATYVLEAVLHILTGLTRSLQPHILRQRLHVQACIR